MSPLEVQSIERKGIFAWVFFYSLQNNKLLPLVHDFEGYVGPRPVKNIFAPIDTRE
jgi:hypothetical protein